MSALLPHQASYKRNNEDSDAGREFRLAQVRLIQVRPAQVRLGWAM